MTVGTVWATRRPYGRGNWMHTTREYTCRDRWRVLMSTSAAPLPGARWTSLYRSSWTTG